MLLYHHDTMPQITTSLHHKFRRVSTIPPDKGTLKTSNQQVHHCQNKLGFSILSVIIYSPLELQPAITQALILSFIVYMLI